MKNLEIRQSVMGESLDWPVCGQGGHYLPTVRRFVLRLGASEIECGISKRANPYHFRACRSADTKKNFIVHVV